MERHNEHDELKDTPFLRGIAKVDPFVVPERFFDTFPHAVQQRALIQNGVPTFRYGWLRPALITGALATVVCLLLLWPFASDQSAQPVAAEHAWTESDLLHGDVDPELLYTEFLIDTDLMEAVELPQDNDAVLAYLENEDLALDILIEAL